MITEFMKLNSTNDAHQWASEMGLQNDEQIDRIAMWLWNNKPRIGCTISQHPISNLPEKDFWEIAGE